MYVACVIGILEKYKNLKCVNLEMKVSKPANENEVFNTVTWYNWSGPVDFADYVTFSGDD